MKCETLDTNFHGKNFRDYVYSQDIPSIERHFQEGIFHRKKQQQQQRSVDFV